MKRYKLLKDLPNLKKGTILSEYGSALGLRILITESKEVVVNFVSNDMFEKSFEEVKEPTDSTHWKPVTGDEYWLVYPDGDIGHGVCTGGYYDDSYYKMGSVYRTEKEAEKARDCRLAEVRLYRTSTFKPDFENDNGGWVVYYNPQEERLEVQEVYRFDYGEIVRYETKKDALKSIRENREDWLIYFGVEEEK